MRWAWIAAVALCWSSQSAYGQSNRCGDGVAQSPEICDDGLHGEGLCPANCGLSDPQAPEEAADVLGMPAPEPAEESPSSAPAQTVIQVSPPRLEFSGELSVPQRRQVGPVQAFALTAASTFLLAGAVPSVGHLYAGEAKRAYTSWAIRGASAGGFVLGFTLLLVDFIGGPTDFENRFFCERGFVGECQGGGLIRISSVLYIASLAYDLIDAPFAASEARKKGVRPWSNIRRHAKVVGTPNGIGAALSF